MILKLKAGDVTVIANSWSAAANPGGNVNIMAHGGTIGLTLQMDEFERMLIARQLTGETMLTLTAWCETPEATHDRLSKGG